MAKILYFVTDRDSMVMRLAVEHKGHEIGVCLLQDAVYFGCKGKSGESTEEAIKRNVSVFAAKKDIELRGLTGLLQNEVKVLDYEEIIDLVFKYERIINM